ncbi:MAG TPA: PKD domain-containing protein [Cyclobacteriaceae bacterium]|nr:PKD domain-containing protein [Cyclobacteriaceae bacterium]
MRTLIILMLVLERGVASFGQCSSLNLTIPGAVCKDAFFMPTTSAVASAYQWDFCTGDLRQTPAAGISNTISSGTLFDLTMGNDQGNWYGFAVSFNASNIIRVNFGLVLDSGTPVETNLGNPGSLLARPTSIKIIQHGSKWYGLVLNLTTSNVILLDFGTSLSNAPVASIAISGVVGNEGSLDAVQSGTNSFVVIISESSGNITSVPFPNGLDQPHGVPNVTNAGSGIVDVQIAQDCTGWSVFALNISSSSLIRLDYGSDMTFTPVVNPYPANLFPYLPYRLASVTEGSNHFLLVTDLNGGISVVDIGLNLNNPGPNIINHGALGVLVSSWNIAAAKQGEIWTAFTINGNNSNLFRLSFPNNSCGSSMQSSTSQNPGLLSYSGTGQKFPALEVVYANGSMESKSLTITVQSTIAVPLTIDPGINKCVSSPFQFTAVSLSSLSGISWDFGDSGIDTGNNVSHQFSSPATYPVLLSATDGSGCDNKNLINLVVYSPPVAGFNLPSGLPVCSNQQYTFDNTTTFGVGLNPTWQWQVNGSNISTSKDLSFAFPSVSTQQVSLTASIPGCSHQSIQSFITQQIGPDVNFSFTDKCLGSPATFTNGTSGTGITGYNWTFGDGNTSTLTNPQNNYAFIGQFQVTLTASNSVGCNNTLTKMINVWSNPQPDFTASLPPFSCVGTATPFQNTTPVLNDSNIASWLWQFGDASNSVLQHPSHAYSAASVYSVSLTATSNKGCSVSITKPITISASPNADFTVSPSCLNFPTKFTDASSGSIQTRLWQIASSTFSIPNPSYTFTASGNYAVTLTATSPNGCISVKSSTITVPVPPVVNFNNSLPCSGKNIVFTDATSSPQDLPVAWNWNFDGNSSTGNPASFLFTSDGTYNVKLTTTHASGCKYTLSRNLIVNPGPVAAFVASPDRGAAPLTVQFGNNSQQATSYTWKFYDKVTATSTLTSPTYTFATLGDYSAELTAANAFGCSDVLSLPIKVLVPSIDMVMKDFSLTNDPVTGKIRCVVTILNNCNIPVTAAEVALFLADKAVVNETLILNLAPGQSAVRTLSFTLSPQQFDFTYLCAEVLSDKDIQSDNNKRCLNLDQSEYVFAPYPNPSAGTLHVDWISPASGSARLIIYDQMGKKSFEWDTLTQSGLNQGVVDISFLTAGIYYLTIETGGIKKSMRFLRE